MVDLTMGVRPSGSERETGGLAESKISALPPFLHKRQMGASPELAERERVSEQGKGEELPGERAAGQGKPNWEVNGLGRQKGRRIGE